MRLTPELLFTLLWATSFGLTALFLVVRMLSVGLSVTPDELRGALRAPGVVARALLANVFVLGLLAPLLAGLAIRAAAPGAAEVLGRITAVLSAGLFVAALLSVVVVHGPLRTLGALDVLALALFAAGTAAIGWLAGGPATSAQRQLARVTALRNVGLSLLIATVAVPHGGVAVAIVVFVLVLVALRVVVAAVDAARRRRVGVDHAVPSA